MKIIFFIFLFLFSAQAQHPFSQHPVGHHPFGHNRDYIDASGEGDKKIIIIKHTDTSGTNGEVQILKETLNECIGAIPDLETVSAVVNKRTQFAKGINGTAKKDWIQMYEATVVINYSIIQKELYLISQKSIDPHKPEFREFDKKFGKSIVFSSSGNNGDSFAGRSRRFHYFSSPDKAVEDAKRKARIWLSTQKAVMCDVVRITQK